MRDREWVFTQKQRNLRVTGKTVGSVRSSVLPACRAGVFWMEYIIT